MRIVAFLFAFFLVSCGAADEAVPTVPEELSEEEIETVETEEDETIVVEKKDTTEDGSTVTDPKKQLKTFAITSSASTEDTTPTIAWTASEVQTLSLTSDITYDVKVSSNNDCSNPSQTYSTTSTTQDLTTLTEGSYYVCVTAKGDNKQKDAGNSPYAVTIDIKPTTFSITGPASGTSLSVTAAWGASTNASSYSYTIASDSSCSTAVSTGTSSSTSASVTLASYGTYYICVTATDGQSNTKTASNNGFSFAVSLASLPSGYTINNGNGVSRPGTFSTDMANGVSFTCVISSTTYTMYKFSDGVVVELAGSSMEVDDYTTIQGYGCTIP